MFFVIEFEAMHDCGTSDVRVWRVTARCHTEGKGRSRP